VLHARPETAASSVAGERAPNATCPECGQPFRRVQWRQLFCCPAHKAEFHNRNTARGRTLTPLVMAARQTRGGSRGDTATGKAARRDADFLMHRWTIEDREAGRMSMVEYMALRRRLGFELA
jgi:hypothetical protein